MTKTSFGGHPFLLGFEQLERLVERTAKTAADGYPPYNIERLGEHDYRITLAVAGFREAELQITVEDRQLVVRGRQDEAGDSRVFLHRGTAAAVDEDGTGFHLREFLRVHKAACLIRQRQGGDHDVGAGQQGVERGVHGFAGEGGLAGAQVDGVAAVVQHGHTKA